MRSSTDLGRLAAGAPIARGEPVRAQIVSCGDDRGGLALPEGRASAELDFTVSLLRAVRLLVADEGRRARLSEERCQELVLAIDELASNSVTHGGGRGTLRVWRGRRTIVCELRDRGHIRDPVVGLRPPPPDQPSGRGLWVVSRLCDRVQIASAPDGTTVRVQMVAP